jgi:hypothetical protein
LFAATSAGAIRLGIGATGAGFAAINAKAANGSANKTGFNFIPPEQSRRLAAPSLSSA